MPDPKRVAAIVTEYRRWSHADVILTRILEGYNLDGGAGPNLRLVSLYVDQKPDNDQSREIARDFKVHLARSVSDTLTLGGNKLAVEGVLLIGDATGRVEIIQWLEPYDPVMHGAAELDRGSKERTN